MSTRLYIGNLGFNTEEQHVREAFNQFGNVLSVAIITDRDTGRSRGFGFVEFDSAQDGEKAIDSMNGAMLDGRALTVNLARERTGGDRGGRNNRNGGGRW